MATKKEPSATSPYHAPQKLLVPCPDCGAMVLRGRCVNGRVATLGSPISPVFGEPHRCAASTKEENPFVTLDD
jgi:hypothetical protein